MTAFPYKFCKPCIASDLLKKRKPTIYTPDKIIETILIYFELPEYKVFSKRRKRELVDCRFYIMVFLKKYCKMSLENIGKKFPGDKDKGLHYTSVMSGIQTINDLIKNNEYVRRHYYNLVNIFEG